MLDVILVRSGIDLSIQGGNYILLPTSSPTSGFLWSSMVSKVVPFDLFDNFLVLIALIMIT